MAEEVQGKLINVEPDTPASALLQSIKQKREALEENRENPFQEIIYEPTDSATDSSLEMKKKEKDKVFKKLTINTGRKESSNRLK